VRLFFFVLLFDWDETTPYSHRSKRSWWRLMGACLTDLTTNGMSTGPTPDGMTWGTQELLNFAK